MSHDALRRWGRSAALLVLFFAALDWLGWATGIPVLTRIYPTWPPMTPWTALWLAALAVGILAQSGEPSKVRVRVGRGLALAVGVVAAVVLAEYATGRAFGVDQVWFGDAVRTLQETWPGRPSPQTAISVLLLSVAVGLGIVDRRWAVTVRTLCWMAAMASPGVTFLAYVFDAVSLLQVAPSTGMALSTALGLLLLGAAGVLVRPDRGLAAWLLTRPDRQSLLRLAVIIAGFPLLVGVSRWAFLAVGLDDDAALTFSTALGTGMVGLIAFSLSLSERRQREAAESDRLLLARAEARFRRSMDSAAIGMCLIVPDGAFVEVNGALCELFGYDADTLTQKTWQELTAPEYMEADLKNVDDILQGRIDSYRMLKQYIHADGHRIWGDLSVSCIRDENGQVENFISQIADITDEVAAREQLAQSDEQNRLMAQRLQQQSDRIAAELHSAAEYMASIMPTGLAGDVDVTSRYLPSRELGGDCFDYTWIDDDHLLVYLIDVSGHGIEPALLSVSVHNMLRSGTLGNEIMLAPESVLTELNRLFNMDDQGDHYFTIWYGVYQASTRTLRYASAGAPPAFAFNTADDGTVSITELSSTATPIGMFEDTEFAAQTYPVPPGCPILIYSDGAQEILLADGRQLSMDGFKKVNARLAGSPDWSLDGLVNELTALTPAGTFDDDCSLIQLTFT